MLSLPFKIISDLGQTLNQDLNLLLDRELRIGITGLSRGGKSTLITSLIHLISSFGQPGIATQIPRFKAYLDQGITYGGIARQHDLQVATFPYQDAIRELKAPEPSWPQPTSGISEIRLELRYQNHDLLALSKLKTLYLDIWDYPGEWLMDLMLLDLSYEEFSTCLKQRALKLEGFCSSETWRTLGCRLNPHTPLEPALLHEVVLSYTDWLNACKKQGLSLVVPGRFVLPGDLKGAPILEFIPWVWDLDGHPDSHSLYATLRERYEAYREKVVKKFYHDCFSRLDRQVILIDCLKALKGGQESFMDINDTFDVLLQNFSYGSSNLLKRLFAPTIDKVIFAATKADLITIDQHENLLRLLQSMVTQASRRVRADGSNCEFMILSAIRASNCVYAQHEGQQVQVLTTTYPDDPPFFPGSLPDKWSYAGMEFFQKYFKLKELRAPRLEYGEGIPHLNMDILLNYLLEDKF